MRNLSLNQVLLLLFLVLSSLIGIQAADAVFVRRDMVALGTEWNEFQADRSDRARIKSGLRAVLGYGGFIHNYTNYILRKEPKYYDDAQQNLGGALTLIGAYLTLDTSPAEENALQDLRDTITEYEAALRLVGGMIAVGATAQEIAARVDVDDRLALRGLNTLTLDPATGGRITKTRLLARLRAAIGYGGFIHGFKHYILYGDTRSAEMAERTLAKAREAIANYRTRELTVGEIASLDDIEVTLDDYAEKLSEIWALLAEGSTTDEIDRTVRVDDSRAVRALASLSREINQGLDRRSAELTAAFDRAVRFENIVFWVTVALIGLGGYLAFWLIRGLVVRPLKDLNATMGRLAEGDFGVEIDGIALRSEIGEMARSVKVFKHRTMELHETGRQLRESNEEVHTQLQSLQILKEESEKQAAQAINLAENLAVARDAAEKASARAEADELRIRTILETTTDAIVTVNSDGTVESFNQAAQRIFGWSAAEAVGRNISIIMPDHLAEMHDRSMKVFDPDNTSSVIGHTLELEGKHRDGTTFPIELSVNAMRLGGELKFTGVMRDITERKKAEEEIRRLAMTDPLTGLANRNRFLGRFEDALALARRKTDWCVAVMMLDLDDFKPVNDTFGHPVGDALLKEVAAQLVRHTRESDTVARFGGDEFAVALVDCGGPETVEQIAKRITDSLGAPLSILGKEVRVGVSIGIAFYQGDGETPDDLLTRADHALYDAKAQGKNIWKIFDPAEAA